MLEKQEIVDLNIINIGPIEKEAECKKCLKCVEGALMVVHDCCTSAS